MEEQEYKKEINLNYPVCSYPDEAISRALTFTNGNKPIDNIADISFALCNLVMECDEIDETVKKSYCCLYSYLEFQFELLKEIAPDNE
jgi:hypothetical protein